MQPGFADRSRWNSRTGVPNSRAVSSRDRDRAFLPDGHSWMLAAPPPAPAALAVEDFVTACWECNLKKSNDEGWLAKPQRIGAPWDGMLAVFEGLTADAPDASERRWSKAIKALSL
jgi:hypothetical protein